MDTKEAFYKLFTDDPVNCIKWRAVFLVLILGYIPAVYLYKKIHYRLSWDRRRDIARSKGHVIEAELVKKRPVGELANYNWRAVYQYAINGEQKQYRAYFKHPQTPPLRLYLYYIKTPRKVFSYDEYHYEGHKCLLLLPVIFLPWILAILALFVLKVDNIPGI